MQDVTGKEGVPEHGIIERNLRFNVTPALIFGLGNTEGCDHRRDDHP